MKKIFFACTILAFAFVAVGILRFGNQITNTALLYIGLAEPCFTWISAESMFHYNQEISLFSFPSNYLTSVFNFIPSILLPNKASLIQPISIEFEAPLGATNLLVSLVSNFGIVGSACFSFLFGWFMSYVRKRKTSLFGTTFYFCICALIPFQFFRDELVIFNKVAIMNLLVFPLIIRFVVRKSSVLLRKIKI